MTAKNWFVPHKVVAVLSQIVVLISVQLLRVEVYRVNVVILVIGVSVVGLLNVVVNQTCVHVDAVASHAYLFVAYIHKCVNRNAADRVSAEPNPIIKHAFSIPLVVVAARLAKKLQWEIYSADATPFVYLDVVLTRR